MAKPERLPGGFELANGRAADRVSEKEAEAGRSRRGSRTASAAASPWHGPGLRLQRLHKETFLGAAVSLLVRDRRQAGPRALRRAPRPPPGRVPWAAWPPPGSPTPVAPRPPPRSRTPSSPLARSSGSRQNVAPAPPPRRGPSSPPANGRAGRLPPDLASGRTLLLPTPPSGRASPFSLWAETGPLLPAGGWSSLLPADGDRPGPATPVRRWASPRPPLPPCGPRLGSYLSAPRRQRCPPAAASRPPDPAGGGSGITRPGGLTGGSVPLPAPPGV